MVSFLGIFVNPEKTFTALNQKDEKVLSSDIFLVATFIGLINGSHSVFLEYESLSTLLSGFRLWILLFSLVFASSGLFVVIFYYAIPFVMYWLGKRIGSKGTLITTRTTVIYALLPILLNIMMVLISKSDFIKISRSSILMLILSYLVLMFSFYILFVGLSVFNKYGRKKALINLTPCLILVILAMLFVF